MCKGDFQPLKLKPECELGQKVASILKKAPGSADSIPLSLTGRLGWRRRQMVHRRSWGWLRAGHRA